MFIIEGNKHNSPTVSQAPRARWKLAEIGLTSFDDCSASKTMRRRSRLMKRKLEICSTVSSSRKRQEIEGDRKTRRWRREPSGSEFLSGKHDPLYQSIIINDSVKGGHAFQIRRKKFPVGGGVKSSHRRTEDDLKVIWPNGLDSDFRSTRCGAESWRWNDLEGKAPRCLCWRRKFWNNMMKNLRRDKNQFK